MREAFLNLNAEYFFKKGYFFIAYQPQFNANSEIKGVEALLRFNHPMYGALSPEIFVPLLEESGQILEVGNLVAVRAIRECKDMGLFEKGLTLSINVSPIQFAPGNDFFERTIRKLLFSMNVPQEQLTLELTESLKIDMSGNIIKQINLTHSKGFKFSLDDFGTGYRNINHIYELPIDELKIDKSLIAESYLGREINSNRKKAVVESILILGEKLSLKTVAEGVENMKQHEFLSGAGVDLMQGFLLAKPMSIESVAERFIYSNQSQYKVW